MGNPDPLGSVVLFCTSLDPSVVAAALITVSEAVLWIRDPVLDPGWVKNQDPGSGSGINISDFYPSRIPDLGSRIPDPKTATKERGEKN